MDIAPAIKDPTFIWLAVDSKEVCHGHELQLFKCVAFEGTDTGCRFYRCSVMNVSQSLSID
jgi:hypothetical protein